MLYATVKTCLHCKKNSVIKKLKGNYLYYKEQTFDIKSRFVTHPCKASLWIISELIKDVKYVFDDTTAVACQPVHGQKVIP